MPLTLVPRALSGIELQLITHDTHLFHDNPCPVSLPLSSFSVFLNPLLSEQLALNPFILGPLLGA